MRFVFALLFFGAWHVQAATEPQKLGLEDAKKYAISHNFEVQSLERAYEEARARTGRSRSKLYPTLSIIGGADTVTTLVSNNTAPVGYVQAMYNVFSGFEHSSLIDVADSQADIAQIRLTQARFRIGLDVEKAFHAYLFKKGLIDYKKKALELNETHKKMARQRRASGLSVDSDVLEFDLRESILRSDILLYEQELEEARTALKRLLGEEIGAGVEPSGKLQHQHLRGKLMDYINRIRTESEGVRIATKEVAIADAESNLWRSRWMPKLDIEGRIGYIDYNYRPQADSGFSYAVGVFAKIDLFSGFDTVWERREQTAKRLRTELELKNQILQAVSQTEVAFRHIKVIEARVHLEAKNHERAAKYYKSTVSEYRRGVKNSMDVKVAAEALYDVAVREETYKFDFLVQRIELERALGGPVDSVVGADSSHEGH